MSDDQDFFFDESEPAKEETKPAAKKSAPAKGSSKAPAPAPAGEQMVTLTVTVLTGVVAVLIGVIIGIFVGRSMAAPVTGAVPTTAGTGTTEQAPQLTNEQMQSGELPAGHPQIGGGASTGATGSATTTSGK